MMLILCSFPLINLLLLLRTTMAPIGNVAPAYAGGGAGAGGAGAPRPTKAAAGYDGDANGDGTNVRDWPSLAKRVSSDPLFRTYQSFYNSGSQSWRIQRYGRVCFVSDAFLGLVVSSGTGTALTTWAEVLAANGFEVHLLYTQGSAAEAATVDFWMQYYGTRGITLTPLPKANVPYDVSKDVALSHRVYTWLKEQKPFDVVHFADTGGRAYFAATARRFGIALEHTPIVVHTHSPHLWYKTHSLQALDEVEDLVRDFLERESAAAADAVISPTNYMLSWMQNNRWGDKEEGMDNGRFLVQPNALPAWVHRRSRQVLEDLTILEIVFFGRLELRKGLVLFCDALDQLGREHAGSDMSRAAGASSRGSVAGDPLGGVSVTFLGKQPDTTSERLLMRGGVRAKVEEYIKQRSLKWRFRWQVLGDMDAQARMDYMHSGSRLAVMPSLVENAPYTILECLVAGVPFIASAVGGVRELIAPQDRDRLLVSPTPKAYAKRIREVLASGLRPGAVAVASGQTDEAFVVWHHQMLHRAREGRDVVNAKGAPVVAPPPPPNRPFIPLVSVCVVTFNNPTLLRQTLDSILASDYPNFEIIVVDDGSTNDDARRYLQELALSFPGRGWLPPHTQENRGPGAARNRAAMLARGEFLLFMDDDNIATKREISTFVDIAGRTGADVLTCANNYFYGVDPPAMDAQPSGRWVPLGPATTVGMFANMYGDTNAMIRKTVFESVGGFPEDFGYALEDWELFSRCVLSGHKLVTVPDPLYWYRLRDQSHSKVTGVQANSARTIRPYLSTVPRELHHILLFAQGMKGSNDHAILALKAEQNQVAELRKMLRALANSLHSLCREGKLPAESKNLLVNAAFHFPGKAENAGGSALGGNFISPGAHSAGSANTVMGWKSYGEGYIHDAGTGRIGYGSADSYALRMMNHDWRDSRGATQLVVLNQQHPTAVVVSGWSRAEKVSGGVDSGYSIYVDIAFRDGTKLWGYAVPFETGTHGWQFKAGVIDPDVPIKSLQVFLMFRWHSGSVWWDDIAVSLLSDGLCDYSALALEGLHANENEANAAKGE